MAVKMSSRREFAKQAIKDLLRGRRKEIDHYCKEIDDSVTEAQISRVLRQVRYAI